MSKPTECTKPRGNLNANSALGSLWFFNVRPSIVTKEPLYGGDVDNGGYACVGAGHMWEIPAAFSQSCYNPKLFFKKQNL